MPTIVSATNLSRAYDSAVGRVEALASLDLTVAPGERIWVVGPCAYRRSTVGLVFQSGRLLPQLTASDNVALPLALAGYTNDAKYAVGERARFARARASATRCCIEGPQRPDQLVDGARRI